MLPVSVSSVAAVAAALTLLPLARSCSDFLVTPGASQDGSAMIAYNADDVGLHGVLYHYPATTDNPIHQMISIYEWDTGVSVYVCVCVCVDQRRRRYRRYCQGAWPSSCRIVLFLPV
jgi:hypothetical protein